MTWHCMVCASSGDTDAGAAKHTRTTHHGTQSGSWSHAAPLCGCGHRDNVHAYVRGAGSVGRCLADQKRCPCERFEGEGTDA